MITESTLIRLARCNLTSNDFRPVFRGGEQMFGRLQEDRQHFRDNSKLHAAWKVHVLEMFSTHLYDK